MKILHQRKIWFSLSLILIAAAAFALTNFGLKVGIDFVGGNIFEIKFKQPLETTQLRQKLESTDLPEINIASAEGNFILRTRELNQEQINILRQTLTQIGEWEELRFESVGPIISSNLRQKAIWGIILTLIAIILYIAWSFRELPKPANSWHFSFAATIALAHDIFITLGTFAFLGSLLGYEVNSLFITALLTILGFSINDTIVIFDRIRENIVLNPRQTLEINIKNAVEQTVVRSLNTSLTLILVLLTLLVLGGTTIQSFIVTLLVGAVVGTYSSIFIAAQLLVVWHNWRNRAKIRPGFAN